MAEAVLRRKIKELLLGYDREAIDVLYHTLNEENEPDFNDVLNHRLIQSANMARLYIFILYYNGRPEIWLINDYDMSTIRVEEQDHLTPYDVKQCLEKRSTVHRFFVKKRGNGAYVGEMKTTNLSGEYEKLDTCLYVGILCLPQVGIQAVLGLLVWQNNRNKRFDSLNYCKDFVRQFFNMAKEEMTKNHNRMLESFGPTKSWWPYVVAPVAFVVVGSLGYLAYQGGVGKNIEECAPTVSETVVTTIFTSA